MIGKLFKHDHKQIQKVGKKFLTLLIFKESGIIMAAAGTSTALTVSAVCFLLTFGSCFVIPTVGTEMGLMVGYDSLMPMMLGAFVFLPLGCLFLLGGLVGSLFPSPDNPTEEDEWSPSPLVIPDPVKSELEE
jgi:hypothetical protein